MSQGGWADFRVRAAHLRGVDPLDLECERCARTQAGERPGEQGTSHSKDDTGNPLPGCARSGRGRNGRPLRGATGPAGAAAAAATEADRVAARHRRQAQLQHRQLGGCRRRAPPRPAAPRPQQTWATERAELAPGPQTRPQQRSPTRPKQAPTRHWPRCSYQQGGPRPDYLRNGTRRGPQGAELGTGWALLQGWGRSLAEGGRQVAQPEEHLLRPRQPRGRRTPGSRRLLTTGPHWAAGGGGRTGRGRCRLGWRR